MGLAYLVLGLLCLGSACAFEDKSVYQYLVDNGYSTFTNMLKTAGLDSELETSGPFTVFAPSDAVFLSLDPQFIASMSTVQIKRMLQYHLADGFHLVPQLRMTKDISSKEGHDINITTAGSNVVLNNVAMIALNNDIICNNGVVQPVNSVMIPPLFNSVNIAGQLLIRDDLFRDTFLYLYFAQLTHVLEVGEYTLFAPVDDAWEQIADQILHPRNISSEYAHHLMIEMMKYHIVPGSRTADMLTNGQTLYTLHGYPLSLTVTGTEITLDGHSRVLEKNIMANNGVIHAVSGVLFPHDLYLEYIQHLGQGAITRGSHA